jgi:hypothetical protein
MWQRQVDNTRQVSLTMSQGGEGSFDGVNGFEGRDRLADFVFC